MRLFVRILCLLALALCLALPTRAELFKDPNSEVRYLVNDHDQMVALDPTTGRAKVVFEEHGLSKMKLEPMSDSTWLLVDAKEAPGPGSPPPASWGHLIGLTPGGWAPWDYELTDELKWGPEKVQVPQGAPARIALVTSGQETTFRMLELETGKQVLAAKIPGAPKVALQMGANWVLLVPPNEPPRPDYGYGVAPPGPPVTPERGPEQMVLVNGKTGEVAWSLTPEGHVLEGPWALGDRLVQFEEGEGKGSEAPFYMVSLEPVPQILKELDRPWNYPIEQLPRYQWAMPLPGELVGEPRLLSEQGILMFVVRPGEPARDVLVLVDQEQGNLRWQEELPAPVAVDSSGAPRILAGDDELTLLLADDKKTLVKKLELATGGEQGGYEVEGAPAAVVEAGGRWSGFFKTAAEEDELDTGGHPVLNLLKGQVKRRLVESYRLVELGDEPVTLAEGARQSLVGDPVVEGTLLYYATRLTPAQASGQARAVDVRFPNEPLVLHALDLATGKEAWSYQGSGGERIDESWEVKNGVVLFSTADHQLRALDAVSGTPAFSSPELEDSATSTEQVGDLLLVQTGDLSFCGLARDGKLAWKRDLTPWFNVNKLNNLIGVAVLLGCIAYFIYHARRKELFIRRIAGLNALDEAVGRATEMGKPVLYVHGLADVDDIQILASLSILGHVARKTAEYDTPILVPCSRSVVMSTAQEVVKEAYTAAGRPDAFNRDAINYLTDEQFGYTAGVDGIMLREKPAANFYMGCFYAESLILAETGHSTGAIQMAGTAMPAQLPFFVAACDYTLIGEELYAASAYLSRDPLQVGSLRGQDVGKAVIMVCIFLGVLLMSVGVDWIKELFKT